MKQLIQIPRVLERLSESSPKSNFRCSIRNIANGGVEMEVFDEIGAEGTTSSNAGVSSFLAQNRGKPVHVKINSLGGYAHEGIGIHNALVGHNGKVTVTITGIAASAAAIICMAGDWVRQFENARLMVHRAWTVTVGNVDDLEEARQALFMCDQQIALTMAAKTGRPVAAMQRLLVGNGKSDGTWFDADQALKEKLIDEVIRLGGDSKNSVPPFDIEKIRRDAKNKIAQRRIREITEQLVTV